MPIVGTIPVTANIAPTAITDTYGSHDQQWGIGGAQQVTTHTTRNAIPSGRRRLGMLVWVDADSAYWYLNTATNTGTDADWTLLPTGGGVSSVTGSGNIASSGGSTPNITFTGLLPVASGGTGTATPGLVAGTNITITGTWPNQTVNSTGGAGLAPFFRAHANSSTTPGANTPTKITLAVVDFDSGSYFASSRYTPLVSGYYFFEGQVSTPGNPSYCVAQLYKNGVQSTFGTGAAQNATSVGVYSTVTDIIFMNGSTDYVELWVQMGNSVATYTTDFLRLKGFWLHS